mmetsp:Transcript_51996/g.135764  ORF Transcript_51996/g.135764 Transcript_51996/m.135764 type:complete len:145 (-) Transcript_51996:6611-7045(-)
MHSDEPPAASLASGASLKYRRVAVRGGMWGGPPVAWPIATTAKLSFSRQASRVGTEGILGKFSGSVDEPEEARPRLRGSSLAQCLRSARMEAAKDAGSSVRQRRSAEDADSEVLPFPDNEPNAAVFSFSALDLPRASTARSMIS